jgi:leucyl-tRNA synthetase
MQRNWIGRSRGPPVRFSLIGGPHGHDRVEVYTTRPDTLMGASFIAISPDHPLARAGATTPQGRRLHRRVPPLGTSEEEIEKAEKRGYDTGLRVRHPFDPTGNCRSTSPTSS